MKHEIEKTHEFYKLIANDLDSPFNLDERFAQRIISEGDPEVIVDFTNYDHNGQLGTFKSTGPVEEDVEMTLTGAWSWVPSLTDLDTISFKYIVSVISFRYTGVEFPPPFQGYSGSPAYLAREADEAIPYKDDVRIVYTGEDVGFFDLETTLTDGSTEKIPIIPVDFK
jgi:hypothetical protein